MTPEPAAGRRSSVRVALCTLAVGPHVELADLARPSLEAFADTHGYELVEHRRLLAADRPASWSKVVALHDLAGRFDRVVWVDADAVVVDGRIDLAAELTLTNVLGLVIHGHDGNQLPNLGVAVFRGGASTRRLLERMWRCTDLIDHPWWENAALLRTLGYRTFEPVGPERPSSWRIRMQSLNPAWNSIPHDPSPSPRIVHLAGRPHAHRLSVMAELAEQARIAARPASVATAAGPPLTTPV